MKNFIVITKLHGGVEIINLKHVAKIERECYKNNRNVIYCAKLIFANKNIDPITTVNSMEEILTQELFDKYEAERVKNKLLNNF